MKRDDLDSIRCKGNIRTGKGAKKIAKSRTKKLHEGGERIALVEKKKLVNYSCIQMISAEQVVDGPYDYTAFKCTARRIEWRK